MTRPSVEFVALVELDADEDGALDYAAARDATRHIDTAHSRARVVVRGVLRHLDSVTVRVIGAALHDAAVIEVSAKGPAAIGLGEAVAAAAEEERAFRREADPHAPKGQGPRLAPPN